MCEVTRNGLVPVTANNGPLVTACVRFSEMWSEPSNSHGGPIAFDTRSGNFDKVNYLQETDDRTCDRSKPDFQPVRVALQPFLP